MNLMNRNSRKINLSLFSFLIIALVVFYSSLINAAPDYVTAWPKKVKVETPDPVLGDKPYWEYWSYSKVFAKKFKGFDINKINLEINNDVYSIVLRIYKKNLWKRLNPDYPKQYACEFDIYFNSDFEIPTKVRNKKLYLQPYPKKITSSINRLVLINGTKLEVKESKTSTHYTLVSPNVFSSPIDGRYASFGIKLYYPNFIPGISMVTLGQGVSNCKLIAPLKKEGSHWISLFANLPFKKVNFAGGPSAIYSNYRHEIKNIKFSSSSNNIENGYFKIPNNLYLASLPKVTLAKVLNSCIYKEKVGNHSSKNREKDSAMWKEISERCSNIRKFGLISNPYLKLPRENGLSELGY